MAAKVSSAPKAAPKAAPAKASAPAKTSSGTPVKAASPPPKSASTASATGRQQQSAITTKAKTNFQAGNVKPKPASPPAKTAATTKAATPAKAAAAQKSTAGAKVAQAGAAVAKAATNAVSTVKKAVSTFKSTPTGKRDLTQSVRDLNVNVTAPVTGTITNGGKTLQLKAGTTVKGEIQVKGGNIQKANVSLSKPANVKGTPVTVKGASLDAKTKTVKMDLRTVMSPFIGAPDLKKKVPTTNLGQIVKGISATSKAGNQAGDLLKNVKSGKLKLEIGKASVTVPIKDGKVPKLAEGLLKLADRLKGTGGAKLPGPIQNVADKLVGIALDHTRISGQATLNALDLDRDGRTDVQAGTKIDFSATLRDPNRD